MTVSPDRIRVYKSERELAQAAAEHIEAVSADAVTDRGRFTIALAGGSTPKRLYELLAHRNRCNWRSWHLALGDERVVPSDHAASNTALVRATLLNRVSVPPDQCRLPPVDTGDEPQRIAEAYDQAVNSMLTESGGAFDLVILGLGADGHTASLFPGDTCCLGERRRAVCAVSAPPTAGIRERVTLTYPVLQRARTIVFLISGDAKRPAVTELLAGSGRRAPYPAARFVSASQAYWYLDSHAAAGLPEVSR